jgi:hypothetical protein
VASRVVLSSIELVSYYYYYFIGSIAVGMYNIFQNLDKIPVWSCIQPATRWAHLAVCGLARTTACHGHGVDPEPCLHSAWLLASDPPPVLIRLSFRNCWLPAPI